MSDQRTYYSEEAERREQRKKTGLAVVSGAIGAAVGAVVGIFFAPRSGEETRQKVVEQVGQTVEQGRMTAEKTMEKGKNTLRERTDDIRLNASEKMEKMEAVVQQGRKTINEGMEKVRGAAEEAKPTVKEHVPLKDE